MSHTIDQVKDLLKSIKETKLKKKQRDNEIDKLVKKLEEEVVNFNDYFGEKKEENAKLKKEKKKLNLKEIVNRKDSAMTITLCDASENHVGMDQNGKKGIKDDAFDKKDLESAKKKFEDEGYICEMIHLNEYCEKEELPEGKEYEDAYILIVRKGVECLLKKKGSMEDLFNELIEFDWDTKYFDTRRQEVLNKWARANVCFSKKGQKPNYAEKKGTIITYDDVPLTSQIRDSLKDYIGDKGENLEAEGNLYYKKDKCGIGYHGDSERVKVVGVRIGAMVLVYQWYFNTKPIGKKCILELDDSDLYFMSQKAVGNDWKSRSKITLRHAAGCNYYTKLN